MQPYLTIGTIVKPQGVRGEVKVLPATDDPERFLELDTVLTGPAEPYREWKILSARLREGFVYLTLEGVLDRDQAEPLRGLDLFIPRSKAAKLPEDSWFIVDLIGLRVEDALGTPLGVLDDVLQSGPADVYSVKGEKNFLFPALKRVIVRVDIPGGVMVLDAEALSEVAVFDE